jgi:tetratricopeptide (TPR) repeat protein
MMTSSMASWTQEDIYLVAERAYAIHLQGLSKEAATIFDALVEIDPGNAYCRDALSALCLALGYPEETIRHASVLLERAPDHADALARRCEAYLELNQVEAAKRDLEVLNRINATAHRRRMKLRFEAVTRLNSDGVGHSLALDTPRTSNSMATSEVFNESSPEA